jgi:hypothetical protein
VIGRGAAHWREVAAPVPCLHLFAFHLSGLRETAGEPLILPGRTNRACPPCENCPSCYFVAGARACVVGQIRCTGRTSCPTEGAYARSPRTLGQDAVDAWVSRGERRTCVRRNRVVLISRRWDQVGGSIRQRRWLESPDTGEHDHKPSTHRAGNVGLFGVPVVTMLVCFTIPHARLRVHWASGIPCALCYRGWIVHQLGRHPRRESEDSRRAPSLRAKRSNLFFLCAAR